MLYHTVSVRRDNHTVHSTSVAPWEVPILEFIFEDGNVEATGERVKADRDYPDAGSEMDRLIRAYGADRQSGVPYAASVYGQARAGIKALQKRIDEAKAEAEEGILN